MIGKLAEPPPPKGVSVKEWDRHLQTGGRLKKRSSIDVDDIESGDPTRMMPRLRQIHKLSDFSSVGEEDLDAHNATPGGHHEKASSFGYAATGPNRGQTAYDDAPRIWRPGKLKVGAGLLPGLPREQYEVSTMGAQERYYLSQMQGGQDDAESVDPELVAMSGGGIQAGAQMAQTASRLVDRANQRAAKLQASVGSPASPQGAGMAPALTRGRLASMLLSALTGGQEKVGYKLQGHTDFQGLPIAIENRKGSVRTGKDADGNEWRTKMKHPYGYLKGTKGADGDAVDCYVGPKEDAKDAYVVHQKDKDTGKYDEDKVMLGFPSKRAAKEAFLAHYDSPKFLGPIARVSMDRLRELVASKGKLTKISQVSWAALLDETMRLEKAAEVSEAVKKRERGRLIRKAGPAAGALVGGAAGALLGARHGKTLRGAVTGLGTGATLGWLPDVFHSGKKAVKRYQEKVG